MLDPVAVTAYASAIATLLQEIRRFFSKRKEVKIIEPLTPKTRKQKPISALVPEISRKDESS